MGNRKCCIRCGIIILSLIFIPKNIRAQEVVLPPKGIIIETYLDRLENTMLRLQEEGRILRILTQEQMLEALTKEALPEGLALEEKPKKSILKTSSEFFEDIFEGAQLRTSLATKIKYDDNVNLVADDTKGDWIYNINPSLNLKLTRGQSYLGLDYNYNYDYYLKDVSDNVQTHRFTTTLFYKPSNIFSFQLDELFEGTGAVDLFKLAPFTIDRFNRSHDRVNASKLSAILTYMPWGKTNLAHLKFTDSRAYSEDRSLESNSQNYEVDIEHYLNPITSVYLGLGFGKTAYELGTEKDEDTQSTILGLKYDLTNITKAEAKFSYDRSDYDDGTDDEGYKLDCTLRHKISNITDITGTYTFGLTNTVSNDYRRYHTNKLALSLSHQFTQKISLSLGTTFTLDNYFKDDYIGTGSEVDKEREKYDFDFGLNQQLYKWLNLSFSFKHARTISELADESYRNNVYTLGARLDF